MSVIRISSYTLSNRLILAPMAGVTDRPFHQLCRRLGAGIVVSEMITGDVRLWNGRKSRSRLIHDGEDEPRSVQIIGGDSVMLAEAAQCNVELDAQIIDISMGCLAKKVCNKTAGSALLRGGALVVEILDAVIGVVDVSVTLKVRTGWDRDNRNGVSVVKLAEQAGIRALTAHSRTHADLYTGEIEYETIVVIKRAVSISVFANGDIDLPGKTGKIIEQTRAGVLLIGQVAQGRPWIFREIDRYLRVDEHLPAAPLPEVQGILLEHLVGLYLFCEEEMGIRIAYKHVRWYLVTLPDAREFRTQFNRLQDTDMQCASVRQFSTERQDNGTGATA